LYGPAICVAQQKILAHQLGCGHRGDLALLRHPSDGSSRLCVAVYGAGTSRATDSRLDRVAGAFDAGIRGG